MLFFTIYHGHFTKTNPSKELLQHTHVTQKTQSKWFTSRFVVWIKYKMCKNAHSRHDTRVPAKWSSVIRWWRLWARSETRRVFNLQNASRKVSLAYVHSSHYTKWEVLMKMYNVFYLLERDFLMNVVYVSSLINKTNF